MTAALPARVRATAAARDLLTALRSRHGALMMHQSGGCCDGSAPMCFPDGEFLVGDHDVLLGRLDLAAEPDTVAAAAPEGDDAVPVWISGPQFSAWHHTQLIIDVVPGRGGGFSLEAPEGLRFLTRSRPFTEGQIAALAAAPAPTGAQVEAGAVPALPGEPVIVADGAAAGAACTLPD